MAAEPTAVETKTMSDSPNQENASVLSSRDTPDYSNKKPIHQLKPKYKSIPQDSKAIPSGRYRKIIREIEAVLLEITVDGRVTSNPFDWKPTMPTLHAWADHLRLALKELTK
jgi:hypothetical protein